MCRVVSWSDQWPTVLIPLHTAPQPWREASDCIIRSGGGVILLRIHQCTSFSESWLNVTFLRIEKELFLNLNHLVLEMRGADYIARHAADSLPITDANSCAVMVSFVNIFIKSVVISCTFSSGKTSFIRILSTQSPRWVICWQGDFGLLTVNLSTSSLSVGFAQQSLLVFRICRPRTPLSSDPWTVSVPSLDEGALGLLSAQSHSLSSWGVLNWSQGTVTCPWGLYQF